MELNKIDAYDPDSPSAKGEKPKLWWGKELKPKGAYNVPLAKPVDQKDDDHEDETDIR